MTCLHKQLQENNDRYWRVRNRVKFEQANLKRSDYINKNKVRAATKKLIAKDEILKVPCQICGEDKVEVHHLDYQDPYNVQFLCRKHHVEWHKNNTPIY